MSSQLSILDAESSLMIENDKIELRIDEESLALEITNKQTGKIWKSNLNNPNDSALNENWKNQANSAITVDYSTGKGKSRSESILTGDSSVDITSTENSFSAKISFEEKIQLTLNIELDEDSVIVEIPYASVSEGRGVSITSLMVYPFLGSSRDKSQSGYMFIPDGSGALINYEDNDVMMHSAYRARYFGEDLGIKSDNEPNNINESYAVSMPIYGVVQGEKDAFLAIVESGAEFGTLQAYKAGLSTPYHWITSIFNYRDNYLQPRSQDDKDSFSTLQESSNAFDVRVKYQFLSDDDASYVGMAKAYQSKLVEEEILSPLEGKQKIMRLESLASESKKGIFFKSTLAMTSLDDVEGMTEELKNISPYHFVYKGYTKGGLSNSYGAIEPTLDRKLGSKSQLKSLTDKFREDGNSFLAYADPMRSLTKEGQNAHRINGRVISKKMNGNTYYFNESNSLKLKESIYNEFGFTGLALDGLGKFVYSNHSKDVSEQRDLFEFPDFSEQQAFYQPNVNVWKKSNAYFDIPLGTSNYSFVSEEVPFLEIVLKGYMPYYAPFVNEVPSQLNYLLQIIETGAYPSFILTKEDPVLLQKTNSRNVYSSEFNVWKDNILELEPHIRALEDATENSMIKDHIKDGKGNARVSYNNDTIIYVNYGENPILWDGFQIDSLSYKIVKGS